MKTTLSSSAFISQVQAFLEEALTSTGTLHGVLCDVYGVGVLLMGKSGIGKSEIALDLVMHGHRLVADDVVNLVRRKEGHVTGHGTEIIRHHMEIRGLGIINIKDLFGVARQSCFVGWCDRGVHSRRSAHFPCNRLRST